MTIAKVADLLAQNPSVRMIISEMGHGYGKAKFGSRCKLTGDRIQVGEAVRKIEVFFRDGTQADYYISNRSLGYMRSRNLNPNGDKSYYGVTLSRCLGDWWKALDETKGSLRVITSGDFTHSEKSWKWSESTSKWKRGYTSLSTKQLQAQFKRSKRNILWEIS